jgi:hypothetical protein
MKIRGDEPFFGLKSLCKNVWNTWNWWRVTQNLTMNDIHTCNYEWYRLYRSYENCRRPGVAILNMQMSKVPIISGYEMHRNVCLNIYIHLHFQAWTKWKSEATNPFLALRVYVKMSEIHETGGAWHKILQWMTFGDIFSEINLICFVYAINVFVWRGMFNWKEIGRRSVTLEKRNQIWKNVLKSNEITKAFYHKQYSTFTL